MASDLYHLCEFSITQLVALYKHSIAVQIVNDEKWMLPNVSLWEVLQRNIVILFKLKKKILKCWNSD